MAKLGKVRRLTGTANPNYGKPWGNALGGYKDQPRVGGKFATSAQLKSALKAGGGANVTASAGHIGDLHKEIRKEQLVSRNTKITIGGVAAAIGLIAMMNPRVSVSRKHASIGVRPRKKIGPVHLFSDHSFGIERRGDDFIDKGARNAQNWASDRVRKQIGNGTGADLFDTAIGKSNEVTIAGRRVEVDGGGLGRRWRFESGTKKGQGVPGAPKTGKGKSTKPQGGRKGGAKTVTNTVKGSAGTVRPQRRGNAKSKKKKKSTGRRTYTK